MPRIPQGLGPDPSRTRLGLDWDPLETPLGLSQVLGWSWASLRQVTCGSWVGPGQGLNLRPTWDSSRTQSGLDWTCSGLDWNPPGTSPILAWEPTRTRSSLWRVSSKSRVGQVILNGRAKSGLWLEHGCISGKSTRSAENVVQLNWDCIKLMYKFFELIIREKYGSPPEVCSDFQFGHRCFNFHN